MHEFPKGFLALAFTPLSAHFVKRDFSSLCVLGETTLEHHRQSGEVRYKLLPVQECGPFNKAMAKLKMMMVVKQYLELSLTESLYTSVLSPCPPLIYPWLISQGQYFDVTL